MPHESLRTEEPNPMFFGEEGRRRLQSMYAKLEITDETTMKNDHEYVVYAGRHHQIPLYCGIPCLHINVEETGKKESCETFHPIELGPRCNS